MGENHYWRTKGKGGEEERAERWWAGWGEYEGSKKEGKLHSGHCSPFQIFCTLHNWQVPWRQTPCLSNLRRKVREFSLLWGRVLGGHPPTAPPPPRPQQPKGRMGRAAQKPILPISHASPRTGLLPLDQEELPIPAQTSVTVTEKTCPHGTHGPNTLSIRKSHCLFVLDLLAFFPSHLLSSLSPLLSPDNCLFPISLAASAKCHCFPREKMRGQ